MTEASLLISGVVVTPLVSFVKQTRWPTRVKFLVSIAMSFAIASIAMALNGEFGSFKEYIQKVSFVWAESQIIYQMYFGGTKFEETLAAMGSASQLSKKVFGGFWCRDCGGRVFEDEPYRDGNGTWKAVLTCLLCSKEHQCDLKDYNHLIKNIYHVLTKTTN